MAHKKHFWTIDELSIFLQTDSSGELPSMLVCAAYQLEKECCHASYQNENASASAPQSHWWAVWETSIPESLHTSAQIAASVAVLCDLLVQQMCEALLASVGKQHAVLPPELPHGKREDYLQVIFSFFNFPYLSCRITVWCLFLSQELHRFWLKLIVFIKIFSLCVAGGCSYHKFYFDGLITWALNTRCFAQLGFVWLSVFFILLLSNNVTGQTWTCMCMNKYLGNLGVGMTHSPGLSGKMVSYF